MSMHDDHSKSGHDQHKPGQGHNDHNNKPGQGGQHNDHNNKGSQGGHGDHKH